MSACRYGCCSTTVTEANVKQESPMPQLRFKDLDERPASHKRGRRSVKFDREVDIIDQEGNLDEDTGDRRHKAWRRSVRKRRGY